MNGILNKSRKSIVITAVAVVLGGTGVAFALSGTGGESPSVTTQVGANSADTTDGSAEALVNTNDSVAANATTTTVAGQPPAGGIGGAGMAGDDGDDDGDGDHRGPHGDDDDDGDHHEEHHGDDGDDD